MKKISVCIATYNGAAYIKDQLTSILTQLGQNDEVIISDDGSKDETISIINSFNDSRIKIFNNTKSEKSKFKFNIITQNFQNALEKATGDIIYLADQDDVWTKTKVKVCNNLIEKYDLVLHDCNIVDEHLNIKEESYFKLNGSQKGIFKNMIKNSYLGCCMVFNRKILQNALPFPKDVPHDIWIGLIGESYGKVHFEQERLVQYRRHGYNASASSEKSTNSLFFKINYRICLLKALVDRRYLKN